MTDIFPLKHTDAIQLTEDDWKQRLTEEEYYVLRQAGTERPFTGQYWDTAEPGTYTCAGCGIELFESDTKFDARCGWPSFFQPKDNDRVKYLEDHSMGMSRIEVQCANCHSHLGHVFAGEGFDTPTDLRYCINSVSLGFTSTT